MIVTGTCHCGAIRFKVETEVSEVTTCDCSLCAMRNAVMVKVPENALTVIEGQAELTLYQWNTRRAKHYFCRRCGIYVFHRKRAAPDHFGVNVFCLENFDPASVPMRATVGAKMTLEDPESRPQWPGPRTFISST
jgi:hypothetical protein